MKQEDYRACMSKNMGGGRLKGLSKEDRRSEFCIIAKGCSKGIAREEATRLCAESAANPAAPKPRRTRGKCKIEALTLASCVIKSLEGQEITLATLSPAIASCSGQKSESPSREKFIKKCFKENAVTGDLVEASKLRPFCSNKWKELGTAS